MGEIAVIEGEFNGFLIRLVQEEDFEILHKHLKHNFFRDEPLNQLVGYSDRFVEDMVQIWRPVIPQKLSLIAIDIATGKVAGVRITAEQRRGHHSPDPTVQSVEAKKVLTILDTINREVNVFKKYGIDRYAEFVLLSVDREFRRRGLAMELYNRTVALLKSRGIFHVKCAFSSPFSRRNGEKLGFQELVRKKFIDFKDADGDSIVPNAGADEMFTLSVLEL